MLTFDWSQDQVEIKLKYVLVNGAAVEILQHKASLALQVPVVLSVGSETKDHQTNSPI